MNDERLRALLRDAPIPDAAEAEERGLRVVRAAFDERPPPPRRPRLGRLAIALAAGLLLCGLVLSPAGAEVRDWIGDVFEPGIRDAEPALTDLPGGGRLLVESASGPWLVQADGSQRLLGDYEEATWSPRGRFVVVTNGRQLTAVERDGDPHWSLAAPQPISEARWSPSPGYRVAYLSGDQLRVVAGDGSGDRLLKPRVAPIAPAWRPGRRHVLAFAKTRSDLRVVDADSGRQLDAYRTPDPITAIEWSANGDLILVLEHAVTLLDSTLVVVDRWDAAPIDRLLTAAPAPDDGSSSPRSSSAVLARQVAQRGPADLKVRFRAPAYGLDLLGSGVVDGSRLLAQR